MEAALLAESRDIQLSATGYDTFIKYMGSKAKILDFVVSGIDEAYLGGAVCDLFAGSSCLAGAIGRQTPFISNDIQSYSAVLASYYLNAHLSENHPSTLALAEKIRKVAQSAINDLSNDVLYRPDLTLIEFKKIEEHNRNFISEDFSGKKYHLFQKYYSGTWWSAEQCIWIDAIKQVADEYEGTPVYDIIMCCLMHAAAYCSQGTGHFAQYRDAKTESSLRDILQYRQRSLIDLFMRKYERVSGTLPKTPSPFSFSVICQDFVECLNQLPENTTIYADPPYCFVHYSRFYHALETLVQYDYPDLQIKSGKLVKGRYREDRHQSPFCIKTKVKKAFEDLFIGTISRKNNLVLSYSNTGMISIEELSELANSIFNGEYSAELLTQDYKHMTMGRRADRSRDVKECLILFKRK